MLLLPSHRLRRRRFHNSRRSVFTYGWLRRHCDQTRPPPDRRAGADRRRRALGVPGGRAAGARRAVAAGAQSVPDHRRHLRGRSGGGRAGRRSASLAARGRGTGAGVGELPLEPGLSRERAAHDARRLPPLSPAIHLGADRRLVIGVRARRAAGVTVDRLHTVMPTPGEIFGYMLDTLFTDQIYGDLEQLERINTLVHSAPQAARGERPIETLMLAPSVDPREIASRHVREMPQGLRVLLRVIGGRDESGYQLASYLMFEAGYTRALIELGYRDAMEARSALMAFMSGEKLPQGMTAAGVAQAT